MSKLILIEKQPNGKIVEYPLDIVYIVEAMPGAVYMVIDKDTGEALEDLLLKRSGNMLEVQINNETIARIGDFYFEDMTAAFSTNGSLAQTGDILIRGGESAGVADGAIVPVPSGGISAGYWIGGGALLGGLGALGGGGGGGGGDSGGGGSTADTTAPRFTSGTTATAIEENSGAGQVVYTATATDASTVTYSLKGTNDDSMFSINSSTGAVTLTVNPDYETKSSYSFTVVATDTSGNISERAVALSINDIADETPPVISNVSIPNGAMHVGNVVTVTITVDADTDTYTVMQGTVGGFPLSNFTKINDTTYTAKFTVTEGGTDVAAGSDIPVNITIDDSIGNTSSAYTTAISQGGDPIDANSPSAPSTPDMTEATDTGISNTDNITNDNTPEFTGTAEANSTVTLRSSVDGLIGTATADGSGNWNITPASALTDGDHNITATTTDIAGNTSAISSALSITIETSSPSAPSKPDMTSGTDTGISNTDNVTSDNTPTFTGTAEANSTVTLISSVDGTVGTITADGSGNWSITSSSLSSGDHNITATATDVAGNTSAVSSALSITIDVSVPSAPSVPDMTAETDTGISSTDNITSTNTPTFTGTADADTIVTLTSSIDGTIGQTTADGTGNWSINSYSLTSGDHNITATAKNSAGINSPASSELVITIDTSSPSAPSTPDMTAGTDSGLSTDNITNNSTPTFTGTAEANSTVTLISSIDGTVGTAIADGFDDWSITSSILTEGEHSITAISTDAAGNISEVSSALVITIDTSVPSISTPDMTEATDTGISGTDNITNNKTPTFNGTAEANSTITLTSSVDGTIGTATADETGNWSISSSILTEGEHDITATAVDAAGNNSAESSVLAITIDTSTPSSPSTPDMTADTDTGSSHTDNITSDNTPTFTGTAEANSTVTLISSVNGEVGTSTTDGDGNWSITSSGLNSGDHNMTATATDAAGNTSEVSSALAINIDATVPSKPSAPDMTEGTDSGSSSTDNITNDDTPIFTGTADKNTTITLISSADGILGTTSAIGNGSWSFTSSTLSEGDHNITATSTNAAGNVSPTSSATSITIDTTVAVPDFELHEDTGSSGNDGITKDATIDVTLAGDAASWQYSLNSGSTWNTGGGTSFELGNNTTYATGAIQVRQTDIAGNTSSAASNTSTITTDMTVAVPSFALRTDSGTPGDGITNDATVDVTLAGDVASWQYSLNSGSTWNTGSGTSFELGDNTTYGTGAIQVHQTDIAGNTSSAASNTSTITTDMTVAVPSFELHEDTGSSGNDGITKDATIDVTLAGEVASWQYSLNGGSTWNTGSGTSFELGDNTTYGTGAIQVRQTDTAGNTSNSASNASTITTDMTVAVPSFALHTDSGTPADGITNDATVDVTLAGDAASWQYSLNSGGTWNAGSGTSFELADNTTYGIGDIQVRQTDVAGNMSSTASNASAITTDTDGPSVDSIAITSATGIQDNTLNAGDVVSVTVTMDQATTITGTPQLGLNIGGTTVQASYSSGSSTSTNLVFNYTIQAGQTDANGISIDANSLSPNGGSLKDAAGNEATLTHTAVANNASYMVDTTAPDSPDFTLHDDTGTPGDGITNDATVDVTLAGDAASWQYSLNSGSTWNTGSGTSFELADNTIYNIGDIQVHQTDLAGNVSSETSNTTTITTDMTIAAPSFSLHADNGTPGDGITNDATVDVILAVDAASWEYSLNGGSTWNTGSGTSFELADNTTYNIGDIQVHQTDLAGNVSNETNNASAITTDMANPTFSSSSPLDNATDVPLTSDITITFNENIALGTGNIIITDGSDIRTIDVENHSGQLSIAGDTLTIDPSLDLSNGGSTYHVEVDSGAITDIAGNGYAGTVDATTFETIDTSIVVFDLVNGNSSDHSSRTFAADIDYTVYILVDSNSFSLATDSHGGAVGASWGTWSGANNLGSNDSIVIVGDSGPIDIIPTSTPVAVADGSEVVTNNIISLHQGTPAFREVLDLTRGGQLSRYLLSGVTHTTFKAADLWNGTAANLVGIGADHYLQAMPTNILTSQGLV